ncbi:hypothetical protein TNCV_1517901 [Trichonephila clavipes]|nr:hypothetical protein TNCV_1517901 [Trichonephila clavipes]
MRLITKDYTSPVSAFETITSAIGLDGVHWCEVGCIEGESWSQFMVNLTPMPISNDSVSLMLQQFYGLDPYNFQHDKSSCDVVISPMEYYSGNMVN